VGKSIAVQQNFFEAGATSLNLVQLHIQLQRYTFPTLTLLDLFTHSSPVALTHWLFVPTMQKKTRHPVRFYVTNDGCTASRTPNTPVMPCLHHGSHLTL